MTSRKWWLLVGGLILFAAVFTWLEGLARNEAPGDGAAAKTAASGPAPPEVRRRDDGGVEIRHDFFRRTTIRLEDEEAEQELFDCLTGEIEERFGGGTAGWNRGRVQRETEEAKFACLGSLRDLPRLPVPPAAPTED